MKTIKVKTPSEGMIDITQDVRQAVKESGTKSGIAYIYTPHTTAAITINENADPSVKKDIMLSLNSFVKELKTFTHMEGNSTAHVKSSLIGCSSTVLIEDGDVVLGTWQGIFLCEFDGPRTRKVHIKIIKG